MADHLPSRPGGNYSRPPRLEDLEGRLLSAWRGLNAQDQELALEMVERLAGRIKPRIIGEEEG